MTRKIIIFGGSGNLALKKLLPALYNLNKEDLLIIAYSRSDLKTTYDVKMCEFYGEYSEEFINKIMYIQGEYKNLSGLKEILDQETVLYFSVPPEVYPDILKNIHENQFQYKAIAIEKPHGSNQESFKDLRTDKPEKMFFIDHYLTKELSLAFDQIRKDKKEMFDLLTKDNIHSIECYFNESITAQGRKAFDMTGVIKDTMQNHLIGMLVTTLAESMTLEKRMEILLSIQPITSQVSFGQYEGYAQEMDHPSNTETHASFSLAINAPSLSGIPIFMSAGKALACKKSTVEFNIKKDSICKFFKFIQPEVKNCEFEPSSGKLVFTFAPESKITLEVTVSKICESHLLVSNEQIREIVDARYQYHRDYDLVLNNLVEGAYFPASSYDEVQECWRIITPLLESKEDLKPYQKGVHIPKEALELRKKNTDYE